jgi:hypothetical protein
MMKTISKLAINVGLFLVICVVTYILLVYLPILEAPYGPIAEFIADLLMTFHVQPITAAIIALLASFLLFVDALYLLTKYVIGLAFTLKAKH